MPPIDPKKVLVGYFGAYGGKRSNAAEETARKLAAAEQAGTLNVPEGVDVEFHRLDRDADSVDRFIAAAQSGHAAKVLLLGEELGPLKVERLARDRGLPPKNVFISAGTAFLRHGSGQLISTDAPVTAMAAAAGAKISADAGTDYCNYVYYRALKAGLNAVFVHVNSGLFEHFRGIDGAARGVNAMLGAWFGHSPALAAHTRGVGAMFARTSPD